MVKRRCTIKNTTSQTVNLIPNFPIGVVQQFPTSIAPNQMQTYIFDVKDNGVNGNVEIYIPYSQSAVFLQFKNNSISDYPNPAKQVINLCFESAGNCLDQTQWNLHNNNLVADLQFLPEKRN